MRSDQFQQQQEEQQQILARWFFFGNAEQKSIATKHYRELENEIKRIGKNYV